ncbi:MAG: hypothetical protein WCX46_01695 [Candidatus Paceibacterota bacterium]
MQKLFKITLISFVVYLSFAFFVSAQTQSSDISLSINPENPRANENVTATLSSYATDLNKSRISWTLNGQLAIDSVGQKNFSFTVGASGSQTILDIQIQTSDGSFINKQAIISPADIDMVWEAVDTYVPPFYKGKTMTSSQSVVKVVAIPNSNNGEKYIYNWKQDGNNKVNSSGYAKNSYTFKNSYLSPTNTIEVSVSDLYGNSIGNGKITIKPSAPKILFYEQDPNLGTKWEKTIDNGYMINSEGQTLVAEPYFFWPKNLRSGDLDIKWSLGESEISTPSTPNELGIKPESGQSGTSVIKISINNMKTLFLNMTKTLNVNF